MERRYGTFVLAAALTLVLLLSACSSPQRLAGDGWDLLVHPSSETLSIRFETLGTVIENGRLFLNKDGAAVPLGGWSVEKSDGALIITAESPQRVTITFTANGEKLNVRSSSDAALLRGDAPAGANRIPGRFAEADKMIPFLSNEDYTGADYYEHYYIPPSAPHVMYLSLGFVDAECLHGLFDRPTNTALRFPRECRMRRATGNPTVMEIAFPLREKTTLIEIVPEYYTEVLGLPNYVPFDDRYHETAPTGWNHWLAFFRDVTEKDIVDHADWISENLKAYGMLHCQLDDGYDHEEHRHWYKDWDPVTFPHGPGWLAEYITSKGLLPGLWTVPYSYCVEHGKPEWFLRDENGNVVMDYQGGGELDFSREDVIRDYWRPLLDTLKQQGWKYHKFDMGSTVDRWLRYQDRFHDTTKTPYDLSRETLSIFREIMGPEIWHTNHPDQWGGRMGLVDVVGCGRDPGPGWRRMQHFLEVISNNTYQNHLIWYSDPDCIVLRGSPTRADLRRRNRSFLTLEEARTCASLLSLAGLQFLSGDDLLNLEQERVTLIKKTIPILPIFPLDLFGRGRDPARYPEICDLKVNMASGVYDVIAATNWGESAEKRTISFADDLALPPDRSYRVFDFWREELLGTFENDFLVSIPPHGTRVLFIRPALARPQLLAVDRHITGAQSIRRQQWDAATLTLGGSSDTVPGAGYSLFFFIPQRYKVIDIFSNAEITAETFSDDGLLRVQLVGREDPVDWKIEFAER